MRLSKIGLKTQTIQNNNEKIYPAQNILLQSGQLVQYGSGIMAYNNVPLKVKNKIEQIIKDVLEKNDCVEISLPILQPKHIWEESGRWQKYVDNGTMLTVNTNKGEYGLAPTAEEAVVDFAKEQINSYKKLPVVFYQIGEKYRNEIRTRGYLFRGKAFSMMDAYSFNKDSEDLEKSYDKIKKCYLEIFEKLGIDVIPVAANNGDIGGNKSEEFMVLAENIGEDKILIDENTNKAFNIEIKEREDYEEYLKKEYGINDIKNLKEKRAMELGHIFQLGTKYSNTMNATYTNEKGKQQPYYMGCYGIGISRTLGMIYEKSLVRDKKGKEGIVLPVNLAPYLLQIIAKGEEREKIAHVFYEVLKEHNVETIFDDRKDIALGKKVQDCKVLGTPYIAILGEKTKENEVEIENSLTGEKYIIKLADAVKLMERLEKEREKNVNAKLEDYMEEIQFKTRSETEYNR